MASYGNLILVFGVFVFYSFIGWGIGSLYHEPVNGMDPTKFLEPQDSASLCASGTLDSWNSSMRCTDIGFGSSALNAVHNYIQFIFKLGSTVESGFSVMLYQNKHIPYLIDIFVITPFNFLLIGASVFLFRGGGS